MGQLLSLYNISDGFRYMWGPELFLESRVFCFEKFSEDGGDFDDEGERPFKE